MDRPGREVPKEYREIATELVDNQGWGYSAGAKRGGHPTLYPADSTQRPITISTTPGNDKELGRPDPEGRWGVAGTEEGSVTMEWSVTIESRAPEGTGTAVTDEAVGELVDLLADLGGVVAADDTGIMVTVTVDGDSDVISQAIQKVAKATHRAGLPVWPTISVEAVVGDELDRRQSVPNFPTILGTTEVCRHLEITRQRLHQLRKEGRFPRPVVELAATPVWLQTTIDSFAQTWDRSSGRRRLTGAEFGGELRNLFAHAANEAERASIVQLAYRRYHDLGHVASVLGTERAEVVSLLEEAREEPEHRLRA